MADRDGQRANLPPPESGEEDFPARKRRKPRRGAAVLFWLLVIVASSCLLAWFALMSVNDLFGFGKEDRQIEVTVERGMTVTQIASLLEEEGVIDHALTFRLYAAFRKRDTGFLAGDYVLNSKMGYDRIISALQSGDTIKEEVTIIFYEGMSIREMAALLQEKGVCDALEFIAYLENADLEFEFVDMLPENPLRFRRLEGYLFPDTYDFYVGENVASVARKFLRNFQNRVFPEIYQEILNAGMTLDEAVTLASLIQEEASNEEQMGKVSSVFHNRMDNPAAGLPRLQSDVTIHYVERDIKPYQSRIEQQMYDAYNTYVCEGLPVGPICSSGLAAIRAAIHPEDTSYYFFVTDVNGVYYYSKTIGEHYTNVRKAAAAGGAAHGTDVQ